MNNKPVLSRQQRNAVICRLLFLLLLSFTKGLMAQQTYNHVFNPMQGFVHETEKPYRDELCLNGKWEFMPVYENDISKFSKPETFRWDAVPLKIPSPWNVNSFAAGDGGDFCTYPSYPEEWDKAQIGWMKKEFDLPTGWADRQVMLHFEAIAGFARIYVNEQLAGENLDIFFPTELDVTSLLKTGRNEVLVGVAKAGLTDVRGQYGCRNYVAGSFWGQHIAGIWQDVSLIAVPKISIADVFVMPDVAGDKLEFVVTVRNNTSKEQQIQFDASIRKWYKEAVDDIDMAPATNGVLKGEVLSATSAGKNIVKGGDSITVVISTKVEGRLDRWTPDEPNLYGAVISLKTGKKKTGDIKYTRFGWRQFSVDGTRVLLNGDPIILKGDSWHFMGIPQMTRRYAWGWYKMLKDANANAVRLHAQPYPSFYLDVADEMGICVLDETGIWSSDGGPKMDSEVYWQHCKRHLRNMVMRDRNHSSVFGWSVCNETLPVAVNVFHAPESIVQRQVDEINNWVEIVRELDPTRTWISGDGEDMRPTNLPTVIGHYGNENSMKEWSSEGKPWGVGETGMGYYGTPKQISAVNGNRAYESQLGRMEGLAVEAYDLISKQQKYEASYTSVFNIVWYGLKPLPLGLRGTSRPSRPKDGIFFSGYQEGIPGVQPERIGPYTSTINPGYDPGLPLYDPWPMFDAVRAANAVSKHPFTVENKTDGVKAVPSAEKIDRVGMIGEHSGNLKEFLDGIGVPFFGTSSSSKQPVGMVIIDGQTAVLTGVESVQVSQCLSSGGKVLVWGISPGFLEQVNVILPYPLELTTREATSFLLKMPDTLVAGLEHKDFYFTELTRRPVMYNGLSGDAAEKGTVLVEACNTDWSRWNSRPEYLKTSAVYRSEQETKPSGAAIVKIVCNKGEIYICNLDLPGLRSQGEELFKTLLSNLGVVLNDVPVNSLKALSAEGMLERAIVLRVNMQNEPWKMSNEEFVREYESTGRPELTGAGAQEFFSFGRDEMVCLSFWVYSPRSLKDLLVEPDMPKLDMILEGHNNVKIYVNGQTLPEGREATGKLGNMPLDKGWNHILLRPVRMEEGRTQRVKVRLESNKKEFMEQLKSSVGQY